MKLRNTVLALVTLIFVSSAYAVNDTPFCENIPFSQLSDCVTNAAKKIGVNEERLKKTLDFIEERQDSRGGMLRGDGNSRVWIRPLRSGNYTVMIGEYEKPMGKRVFDVGSKKDTRNNKIEPVNPSTVLVDKLMKKVLKNYVAMDSYHDTITTSVDHGRSFGTIPKTTITTDFEREKQKIRVEKVQANDDVHPGRHYIMMGSDKCYKTGPIQEVALRKCSRLPYFSNTTFDNDAPQLLLGRLPNLWKFKESFVLDDDVILDGKACYLLTHDKSKGRTDSRTVYKYWIEKESYNIIRSERISTVARPDFNSQSKIVNEYSNIEVNNPISPEIFSTPSPELLEAIKDHAKQHPFYVLFYIAAISLVISITIGARASSKLGDNDLQEIVKAKRAKLKSGLITLTAIIAILMVAIWVVLIVIPGVTGLGAGILLISLAAFAATYSTVAIAVYFGYVLGGFLVCRNRITG